MVLKPDWSKIISALLNDDESALEELFNYYYPRLYNYSKTFLKIDNGIDDIIQEVFLKIWKNRKEIHSGETLNSFIYTITRNQLLNEIRTRLNDKKKREQLFKVSIAEEYLGFENVEYTELQKKIEIIIEVLPEKQKEVFQLSRKEGLSHKEIGEKLKISTKTVEYHINQSIKTLKERLKELGLISLLYLYLFL